MPSYQAPDPSLYTGRRTDPGTPPDYWYQTLRFLDLTDGEPGPDPQPDYALLGYACEEGVRRNQGRPGTVDGPDAIRRRLGRLAHHLGDRGVADAGTVRHDDGPLEATQLAFGNRIRQLLERGITPIGLGGGHDIAYAHFLGLQQFLGKRRPDARLGILNLDAHFDLRPFGEGSTSGTPFRQILTFHGERVRYLAVGIQPAANPPSLFRAAAETGADWILAEDCTAAQLPAVWDRVGAWLAEVDHLYLTVDLDGFSSAYAPGVSAPSPLGFAPDFAFPLLRQLTDSGKLLSADVAELNPAFDRDGGTAALAARIVGALTTPER